MSTFIEQARFILAEPLEIADLKEFDISDICVSIHNKVESLSILSTSLETPAEDKTVEENVRKAADSYDRPIHEHYSDIVRTRFPLADHGVVDHCGTLNWARYHHLQMLQEGNLNAGLSGKSGDGKSTFHDSGVGSSCAKDEEYAATVISSITEGSLQRMPPLPAEARAGKSFECEICKRMLQIRTTKLWR